jgi:hypothetical protein
MNNIFHRVVIAAAFLGVAFTAQAQKGEMLVSGVGVESLRHILVGAF